MPPATGQVWERLPDVGNEYPIVDLVAFLPGPTSEADTLLRIEGAWGIYKYVPDHPDGPWDHLCAPICSPKSVAVTQAGSLLIGSPAGPLGVDRSTDGGRTWQRDVLDGTAALFGSTLLGGAVFADDGFHAWRSLDDGAPGTWEKLGGLGGFPVDYGEVPPSDALPQGRMLAAVYNGVTTSDDGGETWTPTDGAFGSGTVAWSLAFAEEPGHPYGGYALAGLGTRSEDNGVVVRSDDGGVTWVVAHRFDPEVYGLEEVTRVEVAVSPDGSVWAGLARTQDGPRYNWLGSVARSSDGAATFAPAAAGYEGGGVLSIAVGGDGRVYVGAASGLWRTVEPAVAEERGPAPRALSVAVWPNPTAGGSTVEVSAPSRVEVVDALGRVVGAWESVRERVEVDTSGWSPGAYVVRATGADGASASAGLAVAR
ncbi:T9SS type A sorting domain-containing protein [Rubrivirga sp. IMCC45206]|uniref:T9SS type A sorting domain-containing protein n=1 Tax=Rubrivirga sp. IMCC45206 TaxID=3391614 RepID=UPI00398FA638